MFFSGRDWETSQDRGKEEWSKVQRVSWWKTALQCSGPRTGAKVHVSTGQRHVVVALGQVAQPEPRLEPDQTSLERPDNSYAATLHIQPDTAWDNLQRRMGETPQIQLCQACSVIPKKTQGRNACQRWFNKVLKYWVWILMHSKCNIYIFIYKLANTISHKTVFGVLSVDWWGEKQLNPF